MFLIYNFCRNISFISNVTILVVKVNNEKINQILSVDLDSVKNGLTKLQRKIHSFPATYILLLVECEMFYIGSTGDLYTRIKGHRNNLKNRCHGNKSFQDFYDGSKNKTLKVSFVRVTNREEGFELEQKLLDKHFSSGRLLNVFTNAFVQGIGGSWTSEAKNKQRVFARKNAADGKIANAWEACRKPVSIDGVIYSSKTEASKKLGISLNALQYRFGTLNDPKSKYRGRYFYL